jgi:hypothetical protein
MRANKSARDQLINGTEYRFVVADDRVRIEWCQCTPHQIGLQIKLESKETALLPAIHLTLPFSQSKRISLALRKRL